MREKLANERYVADVLRLILGQLGVKVTSYSDLIHPQPVDDRDPMIIALENAEKMGIKVVKR